MLSIKEDAFIQMALQWRKTTSHDVRCGLQTGLCVHVCPAWESPSWRPVQCHFKRQSRGTLHPPSTARNVVRGTKFNKPVHDGCTHFPLVISCSPSHTHTNTQAHLPKWRIYLHYTQQIEHVNQLTAQLSACCLWAVHILSEINRAPQTLAEARL